MRAGFAVSVAIVLCSAAPAFAQAQKHVTAAKLAERKGEWKKALTEWKAAYSADLNAEYLIGIGDAYAHLGNKAEAKKNYEAYLADPLALPDNAERVKTKVAALDAPAGGGLALPGTDTGPGLALPGSDAPGGGLALPVAPEASNSRRNKKNKRGSSGGDTLALPGPGLTLPGSEPAAKPPPDTSLALPGLPLPGSEPNKPPEKVAKNDANPTLSLPGTQPPPPRTTTTPPAQQPPRVAVATPPPRTTTPPPQRVPNEVIATNKPHPVPAASSEKNNTLAWVLAGVAVVGLGGGAFMYTQSQSAHSDLATKTTPLRSSADNASLISKEKTDKSLSFAGIAGGIVAGGIAVALFAF
jgi:hypothetical protein